MQLHWCRMYCSCEVSRLACLVERFGGLSVVSKEVDMVCSVMLEVVCWVDELVSHEERSGTCEDGDVDPRGMPGLISIGLS